MENTHFLRCDIRPNVKPDVVCNVTLLPFADQTFDVVISSHVLEHFSRAIWKSVLAEWLRLVKVGGEMWFRLPDITWAAERIVKDKYLDELVLSVLYGAQENPYDFHYNGLTPDRMMETMKEFGFEAIHFSQVSYNMTLGFVKN